MLQSDQNDSTLFSSLLKVFEMPPVREERLHHVAWTLSQTLDLDFCGIYVCRTGNRSLHLEASTGQKPTQPLILLLPLENSLIGLAADQLRTLTDEKLPSDNIPFLPEQYSVRYENTLAAPVSVRKKLLGILVAGRNKKGSFTGDEIAAAELASRVICSVYRHNLLSVPLLAGDRNIGVLTVFDRSDPVDGEVITFNRTDRELMTELARTCSLAVNLANEGRDLSGRSRTFDIKVKELTLLHHISRAVLSSEGTDQSLIRRYDVRVQRVHRPARRSSGPDCSGKKDFSCPSPEGPDPHQP